MKKYTLAFYLGWAGSSCLAILLCAGGAWADFKNDIQSAYGLFQKGSYSEAIEFLSQVRPHSDEEAAVLGYWKGICYNRMQIFDKSVEAFEKALPLESKFPDLQYEYGQALYATQRLKPAIQAFRKSDAQGYKPGASQYYIGFLSQLLEDYKSALAAYHTLQARSFDPEQVKQAALLQIAEIEILLTEREKDPNHRARKYQARILPALKKAIRYNESTSIGRQAQERLNAIQAKVDADSIPRFLNGNPIALQPWLVRLSQGLSFDSNVLTRADQSLIQVSNQGAPTTKTELFGKYEWVLFRSLSIAPEVGAVTSKYLAPSEPLVFQNDNFTLDAALKTRLEHIYAGNPAALSLELQYNMVLRDWTQTYQLFWYSRFYNLTLSERVQIFPFGSTTLALNGKLFSNVDEGQNAMIPAATLTQNFNLGRNYGLSASFTYNYNLARAVLNDRIDYRSFLSLNIPEWLDHTDLNLSLAFTLVDTVNQKATRGLEKTINPTLTLTHYFTPGFSGNLSYSYTNNISLDLNNYAYTRHILTLGILYQI